MKVHPKLQATTLALTIFTMGLGSGVWVADTFKASHAKTESNSLVETKELETEELGIVAALPVANRPLNFVSDVAEAVGPAVVRIDATKVVTTAGSSPFNDPALRDPFFRFFGDLPDSKREYRQQGQGSGFIISEDGKIITNAHVVDGATEVKVHLQDGRSFAGTVVGADPLTDIALIEIEADRLPTVEIGDSDAVRAGEWAIAIGNPLGLDSTVTAGIISAIGRSPGEIGITDKRVSFLQTDTAINPGNSGGPLLDASGKAIGVNTAIIRGASGVGFAVPINTAVDIARQLEETGTVEHTYLGIEMLALNPDIREQLNADPNSRFFFDRDEGILIRRVVPGSPAERAGLKAGDIITHINGEKVVKAEQLQQQVFGASVGLTLNLQVDRNGQLQDIEVVTGIYPVAESIS